MKMSLLKTWNIVALDMSEPSCKFYIGYILLWPGLLRYCNISMFAYVCR